MHEKQMDKAKLSYRQAEETEKYIKQSATEIDSFQDYI